VGGGGGGVGGGGGGVGGEAREAAVGVAFPLSTRTLVPLPRADHPAAAACVAAGWMDECAFMPVYAHWLGLALVALVMAVWCRRL